jgi:signal transduction histidine kinase
MALIRDDFEGFHESVVNVVNEKLSLKRMQERIDKYGR